MRTITSIIVHCSATVEGQDYTVEDIDRWHRDRHWKGIGYHYVVYRDGSVHAGREESMVGAHCLNHNRHSIGVCYIGGLARDGKTSKDTRTAAQRKSLRSLLKQLKQRYPRAVIVGHRDFDPMRTCPCFDCLEYQNL